MSGVYIKGIEMPQNAEGCEVIVRIQPNGEVLDLHGFHIGATAIPVPDHGLLVIRAEPLPEKMPFGDGSSFGTGCLVPRLCLNLSSVDGDGCTVREVKA